MLNHLPILGVMLGDSAGVGPELIAKLASKNYFSSYCRPLIVGDVRMLAHGLKAVGGTASYYVVDDPAQCDWSRGIPVLDLKNQDPDLVVYGEPTEYCGAATFSSWTPVFLYARPGCRRLCIRPPP